MLEQALADNTAAMKDLAEIMRKVDVNQQAIIAQQKAALERIPAADAKTSRATKPKDTAPAAAAEEKAPATTEAPAAAEATTTKAEVTDAELSAAARAMVDGKEKVQVAELMGIVRAAADWMGLPKDAKITGPDAKLTAEQRHQMLFFVKRLAAGLTIDFNTDYDFDGDPAQGADEADDNPFA